MRVMVPAASPAVVAAPAVPRGVLIAWAEGAETAVVRVDAQPLVVVAAAGVEVLSPVVGSQGMMLCSSS